MSCNNKKKTYSPLFDLMLIYLCLAIIKKNPTTQGIKYRVSAANQGQRTCQSGERGPGRREEGRREGRRGRGWRGQ